MSAPVEDLRLPDYFPLKLRKCTDVADPFFSCFERESLPNGDPDVARKALVTCRPQLEAYKKCMDKFVGPRAEKR